MAITSKDVGISIVTGVSIALVSLLIAAVAKSGNQKTTTDSNYRYGNLPEACQCSKCGFVVKNPGIHCSEMTECPNCHAKGRVMWRTK